MVFINLALYIISFLFIWFGAGLIISSAGKFSNKLKLSPFAFSFVFLGLLTSIPEFSVGLSAVANHDPDIFMGNLLGGIIVIFLVIIPLMAIFGDGISLKHELDKSTLLTTLVIILAPAIFILDKNISNLEGIMLILLYMLPLFLIEAKKGVFDHGNTHILNIKSYSYFDILKIIIGIGIVFLSSNIIVEKTKYFAEVISIQEFYISLLIIALGTDLPELMLLIRSVISGKKDIAMGDFFGAATASTLLFGIFTLLNNGEVMTINNFFITFVYEVIALLLFYFFSLSKNYISRNEGFALFAVYIMFIVSEFIR